LPESLLLWMGKTDYGNLNHARIIEDHVPAVKKMKAILILGVVRVALQARAHHPRGADTQGTVKRAKSCRPL